MSQYAESFEKVLEEELDLLAGKRVAGTKDSDPPPAPTPCDRAHSMNLAALAFSGGGIRSAVFNLGFIQGLGAKQSLHLFDYLSTVSGGGYIGGWLSALLHRISQGPVGEAEVAAIQTELVLPQESAACGGAAPESHSIRFLRGYSNYLTPKVGFSGDTLALISNMVRNITVMQMLLISLLLSVFSALQLLAGLDWIASIPIPDNWEKVAKGHVLMTLALLMLFVALFLAHETQNTERKHGRIHDYPNSTVFVALLLVMSAGVLIGLDLQLMADPTHTQAIAGWLLPLLFLLYAYAWRNSYSRDQSFLKLRAVLGMLGGGGVLVLALYPALTQLPGWVVDAPLG